MVVKWTFYDPVTTDSYTFDLNPNQGGSPPLQKNMTYVNTAGPAGKVLAFEGRDTAREFEISGVIKESSQLSAFETWYQKRNQVTMTDDLGRSYTVYITAFTPTRRRTTQQYAYKHDYTMRLVLIDWP